MKYVLQQQFLYLMEQQSILILNISFLFLQTFYLSTWFLSVLTLILFSNEAICLFEICVKFPFCRVLKVEFRFVGKKLHLLQDFFSHVYNLVADVFSGLFVVFVLNLYDLWKNVFLWRNYSRISIYQWIKMYC